MSKNYLIKTTASSNIVVQNLQRGFVDRTLIFPFSVVEKGVIFPQFNVSLWMSFNGLWWKQTYMTFKDMNGCLLNTDCLLKKKHSLSLILMSMNSCKGIHYNLGTVNRGLLDIGVSSMSTISSPESQVKCTETSTKLWLCYSVLFCL